MEKRKKALYIVKSDMFENSIDTIDHLKFLQHGNMYMNNLNYYVESEDKIGILGMR